ncbi:MAG: hypothetical protein R3292_08760 [Alcanivorax sp.]|nr:hypothetical protein [Alcanivorax sp.]
MSTALANFLFEAVNFLLLAVVLAWLLLSPVRSALDRERQQRARQLSEDQTREHQARQLLAQARQTGEQLQQELAEERRRLLDEARAEAGQLREQARQAREREQQLAEQHRHAEQVARLQELADVIGQLGAASLRALLASLQGPDLDQALIRAALQQLVELPAGLADLRVEVARPLTAENHALLDQALGEHVDATLDASLGAGVCITTAAGRVEASARALAREAAEQLAGAITGGQA